MTVEELIKKLKSFPPDTQVMVPSDDGRKLGFEPSLTTVYEVGRVADAVLFSYKDVGMPLILIEIKNAKLN